MKFVIDHGLKLMLEAIPDVFNLAPNSDTKIERPHSSSPQELSRNAWKSTQVQLKKSINGFGKTRQRLVRGGR